MVRLNALTKKFGAFTAVDALSFAVEPGSIFAFLGTNGAGKTTTIRMITGALRPTSGSVEIGGFDIQKEPLRAKGLLAVIPDRPFIYGKLTGREFLQFIADLYRVKHSLAAKRIDELIESYGLGQWQHELVEAYSHGNKQRLMLCAALVHEPAIMVLDEPTVGLDPLGARLLKETFRERAARGLTIFLSTHSLALAEEVAHKIAVIHRGKLVAIGTLVELYKQFETAPDLEALFMRIVEEREQPAP